MKVEDLICLNEWIINEVQKSDLIDNLKKLSSILKHNASPNKNVNGRLVTQELKPFKHEKDALLNSVANIDLSTLNNNQLKILDINGIVDFFGVQSSAKLAELFNYNDNDIAYLRDSVVTMEDRLTEALNEINEQAISVEKYQEVGGKKRHNIDITFKKDTSINDFKDLQIQAKQWNLITHSISSSISSDNKIEITNVDNGSIIIGLLGTSVALAVTAEIIKKASLIIRVTIVEYREIYKLLNLEPDSTEFKDEVDKIRGAVEELSKKRSETAISKAIDKIKEELKGLLKEGPETEVHLRSALKGVIRHLAGGGEADVTFTDEERKNIEGMGIKPEVMKELIQKDETISITEQQRELIENKFIDDEDSE